MTQFAIGAALAAVVAAAAYRARALTVDGAWAAFAVGAIVFGAQGWAGAAVLLAFFVPAIAFSRIGAARKRALGDVAKHGPRDAMQVIANGGIAACCAIAALRGGSAFAAAFAGAFAAAAADTWATELGVLSRREPVSILGFAPVAAGLSGGVTFPGTLASLAGAIVVGAIAAAVGMAPWWIVAAGGVAGATLDSLVGASLQAQRWCAACGRACETNPHRCGTATTLRRGIAWLENDAVNLIATLGGALGAGILLEISKSV